MRLIRNSKMKISVRIWVIIALSAAFVIGVGMRIYAVNQEYPQTKLIKIEKNQYEIAENQVVMRVIDTKRFSQKALQRQYGAEITDLLNENGQEELSEHAVIAVTVLFQNNSKKAQVVDLTNIYLENVSYTNGIAPELFSMWNGTPKLEIKLKPGRTARKTLTYVIYRLQFSSWQWRQVTADMPFYLVDQERRYPERVCWKI